MNLIGPVKKNEKVFQNSALFRRNMIFYPILMLMPFVFVFFSDEEKKQIEEEPRTSGFWAFGNNSETKTDDEKQLSSKNARPSWFG